MISIPKYLVRLHEPIFHLALSVAAYSRGELEDTHFVAHVREPDYRESDKRVHELVAGHDGGAVPECKPCWYAEDEDGEFAQEGSGRWVCEDEERVDDGGEEEGGGVQADG